MKLTACQYDDFSEDLQCYQSIKSVNDGQQLPSPNSVMGALTGDFNVLGGSATFKSLVLDETNPDASPMNGYAIFLKESTSHRYSYMAIYCLFFLGVLAVMQKLVASWWHITAYGVIGLVSVAVLFHTQRQSLISISWKEIPLRFPWPAWAQQEELGINNE